MASTPKRGLFYRIRVAFLLGLLFVVLVYAYKDVHRRRMRNEWTRTLSVALVVVREGPVSDRAIQALAHRVPALEQRLCEEMALRRDASTPPFAIDVLGPVDEEGEPPVAPSESGVVAAARYAWDLDRWVSRVDARGGVRAKGFDARIYLVARPPRDAGREEVEGASEQGGKVGVVRVELDETMSDLALFVATHELLHTLGATDKYAPDGAVLDPEGLPEPELSPRYPQRMAEVMARHRAIGPSQSIPPKTLDELAIGATTAREIGWAR